MRNVSYRLRPTTLFLVFAEVQLFMVMPEEAEEVCNWRQALRILNTAGFPI